MRIRFGANKPIARSQQGSGTYAGRQLLARRSVNGYSKQQTPPTSTMQEFYTQYSFVVESFIAGLLASVACGFGVFPLLSKRIDLTKHIGLGYGVAGGLMFAASVYNLLLPAFTLGAQEGMKIVPVLKTLIGMLFGCAFLAGANSFLTPERLSSPVFKAFGSRLEILVFIAMCFHSIPEGVAVGVGYASEIHNENLHGLGLYIALAIAIHNMPEGLAVALPMRAGGATITKCFIAAFLTSLPQPIAAVPASLLVWLFEPLMLPFFGFAAGAMMFLVIEDLVPEGLETHSRAEIAWSFMAGFSVMVLVQLLL
ncbi:MAG: ZIP family metal transporter [Bdellovibrionales bacterium]|nr:ZIP family metal transporter [Bdellovibrionales bacterium]